MRYFVRFSIVFVLIIILLEAIGYIGLLSLSKHYNFSPVVHVPSSFLADENPYFRLRKILMKSPGYLPRYYAVYNLNIGLYPNYSMDTIPEHNEDGYRGPKINCVKGDKYRILFLGGTNTYGMIKYPDKTYPAQAGKILNEKLKNCSRPHKEVEIINGGVFDATSAEELNYYIHKWKYYKPDLVVLHTGGSDEHVDITNDKFTPDYTNFRNYEIWQMDEHIPSWMMHSWFISYLNILINYRDMDIERASSINHTPTENIVHWFPHDLSDKINKGNKFYNPFYKNVTTIVREVLSDSASILIVPNAVDRKWIFYYGQQYYNQIDSNNLMLKEIAEKYNINWMDYNYESVDSDGWSDYSNMTEKGEKQKGTLVANKIMDIMSKK